MSMDDCLHSTSSFVTSKYFVVVVGYIEMAGGRFAAYRDSVVYAGPGN